MACSTAFVWEFRVTFTYHKSPQPRHLKNVKYVFRLWIEHIRLVILALVPRS